MRIGIVGCGLIGAKRAAHLGGHALVAVADTNRDRAVALGGQYKADVLTSAEDVFKLKAVDAVIIATTHNHLAPLALEALRAGKHVLVEKPGALNELESSRVVALAAERQRVVRVGFNHRFHPALQKARALFTSGELGPLMFIRGRYGHGGRIGYEKEWRAQEALSGGGEAIDQGVHLVDLARWFLGDFTSVQGAAPTLYWDMDVEDNAFFLLRTAGGQVAWLHASWSEWKNMFSLEIYGRNVKLQIDGLGGSYGREKLTVYRMLPEMGPPVVEVHEYEGADTSWALEFEHFANAVEGRPSDGCSAEDALAALKIAHEIRRFK